MMATCDAQIPPMFQRCDAPAAAVYDYGCVHEHVKRRHNCEIHEPQPGLVGCIDCWADGTGHDCELIARPVRAEA
jgi:hypothetical protein